MTRDTSSPSAGSTISGPRPEPTGQRRTAKRSVPTYGTSVEVVLGPAPCQNCGKAVDWVRVRNLRRIRGLHFTDAVFWATSGTAIPHPCIRQPTHVRRPDAPTKALHDVVDDWKRKMNG